MKIPIPEIFLPMYEMYESWSLKSCGSLSGAATFLLQSASGLYQNLIAPEFYYKAIAQLISFTHFYNPIDDHLTIFNADISFPTRGYKVF